MLSGYSRKSMNFNKMRVSAKLAPVAAAKPKAEAHKSALAVAGAAEADWESF